jgi:hypothetical protein
MAVFIIKCPRDEQRRPAESPAGRESDLVERKRAACGKRNFGVFAALEHVPKKLLDFFDKDMLHLFEFERFLFDHVIPRDREAL